MDKALGPREREIMEIVYRFGRATAEEVRGELDDPLTNAAVRGMLRILEGKGLLTHEQEGPRYVYRATADRRSVGRSAIRNVVRTFYDNSASSAMIAMLGLYDNKLTDEDLERLEELLRQKRARGAE